MLEESKFSPIKKYNSNNVADLPTILSNEDKTFFVPSDILNTRVSHTKLISEMITTPFKDYSQHGMRVNITGKQHKKSGHKYETMLQIVQLNNIELSRNFEFTSKHAAYIDAIGSIYYNNDVPKENGYIKIQHLINIMSGKQMRSNVREEEIERTKIELQQMREISLIVYAQGHREYNAANKRKSQNIKQAYNGSLLNTTIANDDVKINEMPILYLYAQDAEQISTYPIHYLDMTKIELTGENGEEIIQKSPIKRMTPRIISLRDYFLREVIPMLERKKKTYKNGKPYESRLYSTIYDYLQIEDPSLDLSKRKGDIDKSIENVLEYLRLQQIIQYYKIVSKGRTKNYKIDIY